MAPAKAFLPTAAMLLIVTGCSPEVGSKRWCEQMEDKPTGDWSMNEAADYTQHCLLEQE